MENDSNSIVKRSVVLTAKLVGVFALWVAVLSFVSVTLTGRMVSVLAGTSSTSAASVEDAAKSKDSSGAPRTTPKGAAGVAADKSNG